MAEVVPADFRQLPVLDRLLEAAAGDVAVVEGAAGLGGEDEVGGFGVSAREGVLFVGRRAGA